MKTILFTLVLFTFSCTSAQTAMSVDEFQKMADQPGAQILDVRTIGEYNTGFIKNTLQADWNNKQQFFDRTQHLDKTKPVYVYCLSGARSNAAATALREKGFNAINMEGGLTAWKKAGKPLEGVTETNKMAESDYTKMTMQAKLVLIDFGATWCPPCKKMEPVITNIRNSMGGKISVSYVDGGVNTDLMNTYKVEALPTFIIYKGGKEVWRKQGIVSQDEFNTVINSFQ